MIIYRLRWTPPSQSLSLSPGTIPYSYTNLTYHNDSYFTTKELASRKEKELVDACKVLGVHYSISSYIEEIEVKEN
jgi:hypothetical protein